MAIRRISDLSSILTYKKDDVYHNYTIAEGIKRDVLGGKSSRRVGGRETNQLKNSKFEISWLKDDSYTKYESKNIDYDALCAYITHNIQCEDYDFYNTKNLCGDINITGNVNIEGNEFNLFSKKITLSGDSVNVSGDTVFIDGRETYIYGHDLINISVITEPGKQEPLIGLSGDNIAINGRKSMNLIYDTTMDISWKDRNGNIIPVMRFGNNGTIPTVTLMTASNVGTESNPMWGTTQYARWA